MEHTGLFDTQPNDAQPDDAAAIITPYRDGPLLVRGDFTITDLDGNRVQTAGRTVALCRCGRSALKPFCDGAHKVTGFHAPAGDGRR